MRLYGYAIMRILVSPYPRVLVSPYPRIFGYNCIGFKSSAMINSASVAAFT